MPAAQLDQFGKTDLAKIARHEPHPVVQIEHTFGAIGLIRL